MKLSKKELELIIFLDAYDDLINEPFTYMPNMIFFREEEQRKTHAQSKVYYQAEFDKAARALAMIHVKRRRKKIATRAARESAKDAAVPPVVTVAVTEKLPDLNLQSSSGS
jgi:hypothetical protein